MADTRAARRTRRPLIRAGCGAAALGAAAGAGLLLAGCAAGQGAPDGWRYLRQGPVAVAVPKAWRRTDDGAVLTGPGGRTDGALIIAAAARGARGSGAPGTDPPPAGSRPLTLDGRRARVADGTRTAPDGRRAAQVQVRIAGAGGRPLTITAWTAAGVVPRDPALLVQIVNSIQFPRAR